MAGNSKGNTKTTRQRLSLPKKPSTHPFKELNSKAEASRLFLLLYLDFFRSSLYSQDFYRIIAHAKDVPESDLENAETSDLSSKSWLYYVIDGMPHADSIVPQDIYINKLSADKAKVQYNAITLYYEAASSIDSCTTYLIAHMVRENGLWVVDDLENESYTSLKKYMKEYISKSRSYFKSDKWLKDYEKFCQEKAPDDPEAIITNVEKYFKKYPKWDN